MAFGTMLADMFSASIRTYLCSLIEDELLEKVNIGLERCNAEIFNQWDAVTAAVEVRTMEFPTEARAAKRALALEAPVTSRKDVYSITFSHDGPLVCFFLLKFSFPFFLYVLRRHLDVATTTNNNKRLTVRAPIFLSYTQYRELSWRNPTNLLLFADSSALLMVLSIRENRAARLKLVIFYVDSMGPKSLRFLWIESPIAFRAHDGP